MSAKRYFTGKACRRGHVAPRYLSTRACVACSAERAVEWQAKNKRKYLDAQGESRRVRLYGISAAQYDAMLMKQGGGCAICKKQSGAKRFSIDHDHTCCPGERTCGRCVRGLLCDGCNHGLGNFRDSVALLGAAAEYLSNV